MQHIALFISSVGWQIWKKVCLFCFFWLVSDGLAQLVTKGWKNRGTSRAAPKTVFRKMKKAALFFSLHLYQQIKHSKCLKSTFLPF